MQQRVQQDAVVKLHALVERRAGSVQINGLQGSVVVESSEMQGKEMCRLLCSWRLKVFHLYATTLAV